MKVLSYFSRIFVGSLFIISGLVKANDPIGFSYKLDEYFSPDVLGMEWLTPFALWLAVFICVVEVVLGVALLLGAKMKLAVWASLFMMLFFTFLTFYSAYFNKVTECGCFGDAIRFTPWQSFGKDIVLMIFILILFWKMHSIKLNSFKEDIMILSLSLVTIAIFSIYLLSWLFPFTFSLVIFLIVILIKKLIKRKVEWVVAIVVIFLSTYFPVYCINHLPVKDYRPYAIGKNILEGMEIPDGKEAPQYAVIYTMKHKQTGEIKRMNSIEYLSTDTWKDDNWEITETSEPVKIKDGYEPPIHDFSLMDVDGNDQTENILTNPNYSFLLISSDISTTNEKVQTTINQFVEKITKEDYQFIGVTASSLNVVDDFRHKHQSMFNYYSADQIMLKTIIRSNPGLLMLKSGVVIAKWHYKDFPSFEEVQIIMKENTKR